MDIKNISKDELITLCKTRNIKGYSNKTKQQLIDMLEERKPIIKVATLFSGIGSIEHALDVMEKDHAIVFACDNDSYVKKSYFANYKIEENQWFDDITTLDAKQFEKEDIDLLVGGSPCQSFSTVGKQLGMEDERGLLIYQFIRIVSECKPKFFIFENVKGLTTHDKGKTFKTVLEIFKERTGYELCHSVLNAKDYGIPQSRQRLFIIGKRSDVQSTIVFPPPPIELDCTMKDFLQDNVDSKYALPIKGQNFVVKSNNISKKYTQINGDIALCQKKNQQFNWFGDFVFEPCKVDEKYTLSEKVQEYVLSTGTKSYKTTIKTDLDVARPILSTVHKMHRAGIDNYITLDNMRIRKLTPRECHRLMGFRDTYKIIVSDTRAYQQAGNSIVVNIFLHILNHIGHFQ